jgi:hypothetical protein
MEPIGRRAVIEKGKATKGDITDFRMHWRWEEVVTDRAAASANAVLTTNDTNLMSPAFEEETEATEVSLSLFSPWPHVEDPLPFVYPLVPSTSAFTDR